MAEMADILPIFSSYATAGGEVDGRRERDVGPERFKGLKLTKGLDRSFTKLCKDCGLYAAWNRPLWHMRLLFSLRTGTSALPTPI